MGDDDVKRRRIAQSNAADPFDGEVLTGVPQPGGLPPPRPVVGPVWEFSALPLDDYADLRQARTIAGGWEPLQVFEDEGDHLWLLVRRIAG